MRKERKQKYLVNIYIYKHICIKIRKKYNLQSLCEGQMVTADIYNYLPIVYHFVFVFAVNKHLSCWSWFFVW